MDKATFEQLTELLRKVLESPLSDFYRRKYQNLVKVPSEKSVTADYWESLPLLERHEILETPFEDRLFTPKEKVAMIRLTSGTSGKGILVVPRLDLHVHRAKLLDDIFNTFTFNRMASFSGAYCRYAGVHKRDYGTDGIALPISNLDAAVNLTNSYQPNLLFGFSYAIEALGMQLSSQTINEITGLYLFGERTSSLRLQRLRELFPEAIIVSEYASIDAQTPVALPCLHLIEQKSTFVHPIAEFVYSEVINPETLEVVRGAGNSGELVISAIRETAFPLVRYRTGDLVEIIDESCPCGANTPVLKILGRLDSSKVRFRGGELQLGEIERALNKVTQKAPVTLISTIFTEQEAGESVLHKLHLRLLNAETYDFDELALRLASELRVSPILTYSAAVHDELLLPILISSAESGEELKKSKGIVTSE